MSKPGSKFSAEEDLKVDASAAATHAVNGFDSVKAERLTRVDKNFAHNSFSTFNEYGPDKVLAQSLVVYFYNRLQNAYRDLLGITSFDPYDFAGVMGYSRSYLQTPAEKPYQRDVEGEKEFSILQQHGEALDSRLENVLYMMSQKKMQLKYAGKLSDGRNVTSIDSISILRKVIFITDPLKPKRKVYGLVFHPEFYSNINTYFSRVDISAFPTLRKQNLYGLYLRLVYLKDVMASKQVSVMDTSFNALCEVAQISYGHARRNKNELLKKLSIVTAITTLNVEVCFEKSANGRWNYQPMLKLNNIPEIDDRQERFSGEIFNQLHTLYANLFPEITDRQSSYAAEFCAWLSNTNADHLHKRKTFASAFFKCFRCEIDLYDTRVTKFMDELGTGKGSLVLAIKFAPDG